jgi:hypothetical protein
VITCLQFSGSRVVSGSDDNTLKVIKIKHLRYARKVADPGAFNVLIESDGFLSWMGV